MACKGCGDPQISSKYRCSLCEIKRGRFNWCVITNGPTERDGNQYDRIVSFDDTEVELFDGKKQKHRIIAKQGSDGFIHFKDHVFEVGEIFPIEKNFGREITGGGRKPSKWDIGCVMFKSTEYKQAIALAISCQREKNNLQVLEEKSIQKEQLTEKQIKVRDAEDPFKLIYGWIKQGHITLKESKTLLGEVFKNVKQENA